MLFGDLNINSAFELLRHPKPNYRNVVNPQVSTFVQFTNYNASCRNLVCRANPNAIIVESSPHPLQQGGAGQRNTRPAKKVPGCNEDEDAGRKNSHRNQQNRTGKGKDREQDRTGKCVPGQLRVLYDDPAPAGELCPFHRIVSVAVKIIIAV